MVELENRYNNRPKILSKVFERKKLLYLSLWNVHGGFSNSFIENILDAVLYHFGLWSKW